MSEGIEGLNLLGIKAAIANVDALLVVFLQRFRVGDFGCRIVLVAEGPGVGQLSGGRNLSGQNLTESISAFLAGLTVEEKRVGLDRLKR